MSSDLGNLPYNFADMLSAGKGKGYIRRILSPKGMKDKVTREFNEGYDHGIRTIYCALCLLNIEGRAEIEAGEILGLKKGIESFLFRES